VTASDSERPAQPYGGTEYPSLENAQAQPDPTPTFDYPTDAGLPPPIYPPAYPGPGYPPAPGYYAGSYDPYRPTKPPGTNGMAIAALTVSAASLVLFCGIPSFVGVILGIIAMRETKRTGQEGFGIAVAGTVIGAIPTVLWLIYLFVFIGIFASGWQWAP
jgi:uncharacterized protein DUF4190